MGNYRNFTLTTYFVAHAAARVTKEELEKQLDFILKHLRLDKVYLEPWRGELASHEQIEMCRAAFEARGVKVTRAVVPRISSRRCDLSRLRAYLNLNKAVGIARRVRVGQFQLPYLGLVESVSFLYSTRRMVGSWLERGC